MHAGTDCGEAEPVHQARLFDEFGVLVNDCSGKRGLDSRFFRIASRTTEENQELVRILGVMASETPAPEGARS
jgi:histidinol-phosphate/aromatic aminotransferase/cobyric acid decarboxylase-like protein